jgi:hypothetical protein
MKDRYSKQKTGRITIICYKMNNQITVSSDIFEELYEHKHKLEVVEKQLNDYKRKKAERAESYKRYRKTNETEKRFGYILRASNRKLASQMYQDPLTLQLIIFQKVAENERYAFFDLLNQRINALVGLESFVKVCNSKGLNPKIVAQHVVVRGSKALNDVFKYGLDKVYNDAVLQLMSKQIFSDEELLLERYRPKEHLDL